MEELPTELGCQRHSRNTSFAWRQPDGPYGRVTEDQARDYHERGFFALRDVFSPAEMDAVIAQIDPLEAETETFLAGRENGTFGIARAGEITFRPHLVSQSSALKAFSAHPVFQGLVRDLIGPDVRLYWDQSVYKKPGTADEFPWHQDNGYTYVEPQQYLTCWLALTAATVDNGCPWVVPGVHRHGTLRHWTTPLGYCCLNAPPAEALPIELEAGSVAVFSSLTPHRTGPNHTDGVRKSYILQYAPDGARVIDRDGISVTCDAPERQYPVLRGGRAV